MSKQTIVLLHGWQSQITRWDPLIKILRNNYEVFCPELPGFGKNKLLKTWTLTDYTQWLKNYLISEKIKEPIILAHSFGGRIAIKFIAQGNKAKKLILIASAGIKTHKEIKKTFFLILAKTGKLFFSIPPLSIFYRLARWFLYTLAREKDYYYVNGFLKSTMVKIINEDLEPLLVKIKIPTLILWGKKDSYVPLSDGRIMNQKIKGSRLVIFENDKHNLPFTQGKKISNLIYNFCR